MNYYSSLIDTHSHCNMMVKKDFDRLLTLSEVAAVQAIIDESLQKHVVHLINVGTSLPESLNCITLAQTYSQISASIGIHPNDCTTQWKSDVQQLAQLCKEKEKNKIVAIGECGMDFHYPDYDVQRQQDAFKTQIELALSHNLPLVIHTRQAPDETLRCLEQFKDAQLRGVIHCFSEDLSFAHEALQLGFVLGIGGTITYPKNTVLRSVVETVGLDNIILETDAPFLPPQALRGKQNSPAHISIIAEFIAQLLNVTPELVAQKTTENAVNIFNLEIQ